MDGISTNFFHSLLRLSDPLAEKLRALDGDEVKLRLRRERLDGYVGDEIG